MKIRIFKEKWANLKVENALLKFIMIVLVAGFIGEGALLVYQNKKVRTVITPAFVDRQFYVEGDKASPEYIEMMTQYAVNVLTNYTPETIEERTQDFLRFIAPDYYNQVATSFRSMIDEAKNYSISQSFIPHRITQQDNKITVEGLIKRYAQDKLILSGGVVYSITYQINNGRFEILSYEKIEKQERK